MKYAERRSLEFKALQDEILENSKKIYQIITSSIALSAGLIGYCFSASHFPIVWARPFALLSPFLILIPAMILIQSNQLSTVRIAAYLKVTIENCEDQELPGWQSAMHWCRSEGPGGPRRVRHFHLGLKGILWGMALASILGSMLAWWWLIHHDHLRNNPHFIEIMVGYLICVTLGVVLFWLAYNEMRKGWTNERFVEWQDHWKCWAESVSNRAS